MTAVIAALAILAAICFAAMRGQSALAWLFVAMVVGALEMQAMKLGGYSTIVLAVVTITVPLGHWCFAQGVRATTHAGGSARGTNLLLVGLSALSLVMLAAGADGFVQTIPFQVAAVIAVADGARSLVTRRGTLLDFALIAVELSMMTLLTLRIPVLSVVLGGTSPFSNSAQDVLIGDMLGAWAIVGPTSVALLIAKVVEGIVSGYRNRAERDDLTGLLNRAAFHELAETSGDGVMILCDIDHFKAINDRFGHPEGDRVIRRMASILGDQDGMAGRIGGEEFALLLPSTTLAEGLQKAEAARVAFREKIRRELPDIAPATASFGVASVGDGVDALEALAQADAALYRSKRQGRDRVSVHQQSSPHEDRPFLHAAA